MSILAHFAYSLATTAIISLSSFSSAIGKPRCEHSMDKDTICSLTVHELHPTQKVVGFRQVQATAKKIKAMSHKSLHDYISDKKIPIIAGPDGNFYMIDRHHMLYSLLLAKRQRLPPLIAKIKKNWSDLSERNFWRKMREKNYIYLFDEFGESLTDHRQIPTHISDLDNDPYRSLAWAVREQDGFDKTNIPFAEFRWANFFRTRVSVGDSDYEFKNAVLAALKLASKKEASHLPGFKN